MKTNRMLLSLLALAVLLSVSACCVKLPVCTGGACQVVQVCSRPLLPKPCPPGQVCPFGK